MQDGFIPELIARLILRKLKTLLIDNFDSFTYNLYQLIAGVNRLAPVVIKNNEFSWRELSRYSFDNIVISPGPGRPDRAADFGVCSDVIRNANVPILGVCLGHQGICLSQGGEIDYAATVMHGRISRVHHEATGLFEGIRSPFDVVRYHSLLVSQVPEDMEVTAYTDDQIVMALAHKYRPLWGLQFHPESICTEFGEQILKNFRDLSVKYNREEKTLDSSGRAHFKPSETNKDSVKTRQDSRRKLEIFYKKLTLFPDAESVFKDLFSSSENAFWLDSCLLNDSSRFSFMGDDSGPLSEFISSDQLATEHSDIFAVLEQRIQALDVQQEDLPFDFQLGYVGYFGYELKSVCGYSAKHRAQDPDAMFLFADRLIAFDHVENCLYLLCVDEPDSREAAEQWLATTENTLLKLENSPRMSEKKQRGNERELDDSTLLDGVTFAQDKPAYLKAIAAAKAAIKAGESYELCLTNMLSKETQVDPLTLYAILREDNPAPYACFLKYRGLHILSCSPERFLTINPQGVVETKPIKGTRKRGASALEDEALISDLCNNEKDRAENLMIVDLLRNDLGQVSDIGSVQVDKLFDVESYATVHQLVSTIRSRLRRDKSAVDCFKACFPGGSMTGAPKKRTLALLDQLETRARGVYSGSIGYFSLTGCADFSIVIRTVLLKQGMAEIGVGGAIVDLSDPESEWKEIILKSQALLAAINRAEHLAQQ